MMIKQITKAFPYALLLEADPFLTHIEHYLKEGYCYVAAEEEEVIGVYVLVIKEDKKVEIMNIAVREDRR
ncbi:hypothetical protein R0J90_20390, partial [Micrococcus sp. SIMBA_144]